MAVEGPLVTNDDHLMLAAALGGIGITFLSEYDVGPHLALGTLVRMLEGWSATIPGFCLYHPRRLQGSAILRALVGMLTEPEN